MQSMQRWSTNAVHGEQATLPSIYITYASKCIPTDLQTEKTGDQPMHLIAADA